MFTETWLAEVTFSTMMTKHLIIQYVKLIKIEIAISNILATAIWKRNKHPFLLNKPKKYVSKHSNWVRLSFPYAWPYIPGLAARAPSQYPKRRLSVRSRKVSKPRDLYLDLSDRSEIWPALRQQCCRCACQIAKRYDNLKYRSRGFETSRDLTERRLFGYWDGALCPVRASLWISWLFVKLEDLHVVTARKPVIHQNQPFAQ